MSEILISFLSGAIGGSICTAVFNYLNDKRIRKIKYLKNQIDNFYGPLSVLLTYSGNAFEMANKILDAHTKAFAGEWSQDDVTQKNLTEDSKRTIDISNEYVDLANKNNDKIFEIIATHYSFVDLDDIHVVELFLKNYTRLKIEYDDKKLLPHRVYQIVGGSISFLPRDFQDKIMQKFNIKKLELLEKSFFSRWIEKFKKIFCKFC